jgi:hypothetical protein
LLQAYRSLVRQLHPDKGGSAPAFAAAHAAYSVLSDPKQRAVYDAAAVLIRPQDGWWAVSGCTWYSWCTDWRCVLVHFEVSRTRLQTQPRWATADNM